jgi:NhaA family Na+:H+ antiporter
VALPAVLFLAATAGHEGVSGWAIPAATDIAFAVGIFALLGDRVSSAVKLFLHGRDRRRHHRRRDHRDLLLDAISLIWLGGAAAAALLGVVALQRVGVTRIAVYGLVGILAWVAMHESGLHATIAGVALGLLTPARPVGGRAVLELLEHRLHPLNAFLIVPLFALANAGVDFGGRVLADVARGQVWGIAALGGIGFTVSLFIAQLAHEAPDLIDTAKVGIFAGSLASGSLGAFLLARRHESDAAAR